MASGLVAALGGAAAAGAAYAFLEPYRFRLRRHELTLARPTPDLDVLHLSDLHLGARDRARARFVASLPTRLEATPDLILATGDLIETDGGIDLVLQALGPLEATLGRFYVLGSHDYYRSRFKPPTRYFGGGRSVIAAPPTDVARLEAGLAEQGWISLANRTELVASPGGTIRVAGVDDPYLHRDRTDHIERGRDEVLAVGLTHAPDVVSEWALAGFDLVVAGHTHGGQVRLPFLGALVTNSALPARLAMGPHRIGSTWLHVSPGLGTSRFTPVRFLARPEVTVLALRGKS